MQNYNMSYLIKLEIYLCQNIVYKILKLIKKIKMQ